MPARATPIRSIGMFVSIWKTVRRACNLPVAFVRLPSDLFHLLGNWKRKVLFLDQIVGCYGFCHCFKRHLASVLLGSLGIC